MRIQAAIESMARARGSDGNSEGVAEEEKAIARGITRDRPRCKAAQQGSDGERRRAWMSVARWRGEERLDEGRSEPMVVRVLC